MIPSPFHLYKTLGDLQLHRPTLWFQPGRIPDGLTLLTGPSGIGTSLVAAALAASIAAGKPWNHEAFTPAAKSHRHFDVTPEGAATVLYAHMAGPLAGLPARLRAAQSAYGDFGRNLAVMDGPLMLSSPQSVEHFIDTVGNAAFYDLIILDDLENCLGGLDENDSSDMRKALGGLRRICGELECSVVMLCHAPADAERPLGSQILHHSADAIYTVNRDGDQIALRCAKMREARLPEDIKLDFVDTAEGVALVPACRIPPPPPFRP